MKKVLAIAFMGGLVLASCAKKETAAESNTMMAEPEVVVVDSANTDSAAVSAPATTAPATTAPMATDSAAAK